MWPMTFLHVLLVGVCIIRILSTWSWRAIFLWIADDVGGDRMIKHLAYII